MTAQKATSLPTLKTENASTLVHAKINPKAAITKDPTYKRF